MIIYDIETGALPLTEIEKAMPEFKADSRLKDPAKIEADIAEKRAEFIDRAALSPTTGQILSIGYLGPQPEDIGIYFADDMGGEAFLIKAFFSNMATRPTMIGFNTHSFDLPFIMRRAWFHGLPVPRELLQRYFPDYFVDLLIVWQAGNRDQKISLNNMAKFFGIGEKNGEAKDFAKYYAEDRTKAIEYLSNDLRMTYECAKRMIHLDI